MVVVKIGYNVFFYLIDFSTSTKNWQHIQQDKHKRNVLA